MYIIPAVQAFLAAIGMADATYLTLAHFGKIKVAGGRYDVVHKSSYAKFLGLPVSLIGVGGYGAICVSALLGYVLPEYLAWAKIAVLLMSVIGFVVSCRLVAVSIFKIRKLCPFCALSACVMTTILLLSVLTYTK